MLFPELLFRLEMPFIVFYLIYICYFPEEKIHIIHQSHFEVLCVFAFHQVGTSSVAFLQYFSKTCDWRCLSTGWRPMNGLADSAKIAAKHFCRTVKVQLKLLTFWKFWLSVPLALLSGFSLRDVTFENNCSIFLPGLPNQHIVLLFLEVTCMFNSLKCRLILLSYPLDVGEVLPHFAPILHHSL